MFASQVEEPGAATRLRLLQAALRAFGRRDYDSVGIREIVEEAKANVSAISYHFGGKQGLYLATAEYLAENLRAGLRGRLEQIDARLPSADAGQCRQMLGDFVRSFAENLLTGEFGEDAPGFIFREQNQPTDAFDILYAKLLEPVNERLSRLVGRIRGLPQDHTEAVMAAHALMGMAIAFRAGRTTMVKRLSRTTYSPDDIQRIGRLVSALAAAALDYPSVHTPGVES